MATASVSHVDKNFALTIGLERMRIGAPGRKRFQQCYLWTTTDEKIGPNDRKKATTYHYDPRRDKPTDKKPCPTLPGKQELTPHQDTKLYLEVGLVIGDEPGKCKPTKAGRRSKETDEERSRRTFPRDKTTLRAFIPVNDYIQPQAKFYVGCRLLNGRLFPRVIEVASIFFYPEFWTGLDIQKPAKQRLLDMTSACKHAAAVHKMTEAEARAANLDPARKYGPYAKCDGVKAFMDFDTPLTEELATQTSQELKAVSPSMTTVDPGVVAAIHEILCATDNNNEAGAKLGAQLSCWSLGFFLEVCQLKVPIPGYEEAAIWEVKSALTTVLAAAKIQSHHPSLWTPPQKDEENAAENAVENA
ncbi:hypothetical protein GGS26DRAFT_591053 [Hypomontagnella submonticulosa]|nr:hypothetical protein GGS26DRAFT_591053 [Hypomontagnella submonticulosa]